MEDEILNEIYKGFDYKLREYLTDKLKELGYIFNSNEEFESFLSKRVTRINFVENTNRYFFYLDFKGLENRGVLIGGYTQKITFDDSYLSEENLFLNRSIEEIINVELY